MEKQKNKKILLIVPRSLDLPLFFGSTIIKYAKNGYRICAVVTAMPTEEEKHEVQKSGRILGLSQIYFLKYPAGQLKQRGVDNIKMDIFEALKEEKPQIMLTFSRHGFSQNPDYSATSLAATLAYEKYCGSLPIKLYHLAFPEQFLSFAQSKGFLRKDYQGFNFEGTADKKISTVIDGKKFKNLIISALKIHKSARSETSRTIELFKTYQSSLMNYYILAEKEGIKVSVDEIVKISNRL